MNNFLKTYQNFVEQTTSEPSKDTAVFHEKVNSLEKEKPHINMALLITAGFGLSSETGEFNEIIKKALFQGKPLSDENIFHLKRELGDVMWYWVNACTSLGFDPQEVILENIEKLKSRYPEGHFTEFRSENRKENDL
jgi:NTP pyrophosphatase (non-canonical NTP hydrolase)